MIKHVSYFEFSAIHYSLFLLLLLSPGKIPRTHTFLCVSTCKIYKHSIYGCDWCDVPSRWRDWGLQLAPRIRVSFSSLSGFALRFELLQLTSLRLSTPVHFFFDDLLSIFATFFSVKFGSWSCCWLGAMGICLSTELDAVTSYSEIVPDTVVFDDFERWVFEFLIHLLYMFSWNVVGDFLVI